MIKTISKIWSTFFWVGYLPLAPGTAASLLVVLLFRWILWPAPWMLQAAITTAVLATGVFTAGIYASELGKQDPRSAVIDEVCGQLIALLAVPPDRMSLLLAFLLFRFFDVVKPWPIRKLERFPGGWGIMADDCVAGLLSRALIQFYLVVR